MRFSLTSEFMSSREYIGRAGVLLIETRKQCGFGGASVRLTLNFELIRRTMLKCRRNTRQVVAPAVAALSLALICSVGSSAASVNDPANDFLPSFVGLHNGDLDVLSANVTLNGSKVDFTATLNGPVGETPDAVYVFGLNRGEGTPKFANIGEAGVVFDSTFVIENTGGGVVNDLISKAKASITEVTFSGANISAVVPVSDLPSEGFSPNQYTFNLWPEGGASNPGNTQISDFAPNNSMAPVSVATAPEPGTMALLGVAGVGLGLFRRRKAD
jgi:PEP-CTERM motif